MSDADTLREALQESRRRLFAPLQGLTEEQFRHGPDAGGWNIATHLAHVLRCERMLVERMALALREDEPLVRSTGTTNDDEPALAQRLAVPQMIHGLQASRRALEGVMRGIDGRALERAIVHERLGRVTVRDMIEKIDAHEREHAESIELLARHARSAAPIAIPIVQS